jgi:hypothetical protein
MSTAQILREERYFERREREIREALEIAHDRITNLSDKCQPLKDYQDCAFSPPESPPVVCLCQIDEILGTALKGIDALRRRIEILTEEIL